MRAAFILLCWLIVATASAQKEYNVLNWKAETTLYTHMLEKMHDQFAERNKALHEAIQSRAKLRTYQSSCRERYRKILGELPRRSDLNVQVTGTIKQTNYRIDKVIYESIPGHHVTANLYVPDGTGPFPGVLLFCGHEMEAKATESYQRTAILFALNGFVVLVIDPISQGERFQLVDDSGTPTTRGGTTEHTLLNAAANLVGTGVVAFELWDNVRGLDYLESLPIVDKNRLGCLGNSGGGTQTAYFIGFDERIKVAAPCSYIASRERNWDLVGANDGCQHIPNEGKEQLEISDFLIMFAPKPLLILAGRYDFVDYVGTESVYDELKDVYAGFKESKKVKLFTADDGHGISAPKRHAAVQWFRQWLYGDTKIIAERESVIVPVQELNCTTTGQVSALSRREVDDLDRIQTRADWMERTRTSSYVSVRVKQGFPYWTNSNPVVVEKVGVVEKNAFDFQKIILDKEGEVPLPLLALYPESKPKAVVVWLHEKGKQVIADSVQLLKKYLDAGQAIVMADLRGLGEGRDVPAANDPKYYNREYRNAMIALHIGDHLPGQRSRDIATVLDFIGADERLKGLPVEVKATGTAALSALHTAVMDSRISSLEVSNCISSFRDILNDPTRKDWYSYVIPNVLEHYDIPYLMDELRTKNILK